MVDLTKIDKPFGLLDAETQDALIANQRAGRKTEYYDGRAWREVNPPAFSPNYAYRAAPLPPVTADELAEALRVLANTPGAGCWKARALLARYDAQKGSD